MEVQPVELKPALGSSERAIVSPSSTLLQNAPEHEDLHVRYTLYVVGEGQIGKSSMFNQFISRIDPNSIKVEGKTLKRHVRTVLARAANRPNVVMERRFVDTCGVSDTIHLQRALDEVDGDLRSAAAADTLLPRGPDRDATTELVHVCLLAIRPHSKSQVLFELAKVIQNYAPVVLVYCQADCYTREELETFQRETFQQMEAENVRLFHPPSHPYGFTVLTKARQNIGGNYLEPLDPNSPFDTLALAKYLDNNSKELMAEARRRSAERLAFLQSRSITLRAADGLRLVAADPRYYGAVIACLLALLIYIVSRTLPNAPALPDLFKGAQYNIIT